MAFILLETTIINMRAYVLLRLRGGNERAAVEFLRSVPYVKMADVVYGEYDVAFVAEVQSTRELTDLVHGDLRRRFDIERSSTLIAVEDS